MADPRRPKRAATHAVRKASNRGYGSNPEFVNRPVKRPKRRKK